MKANQAWRKSSLSEDSGDMCLEARWDESTVYVRDSKCAHSNSERPSVAIISSAWIAFIESLSNR
ncbi:DUF397 domain-containing protein [Streptomyces massasporeus]